jgi:LmbE family N-acetylglucosaminyl deacetylase
VVAHPDDETLGSGTTADQLVNRCGHPVGAPT